MNYSKIKTTKIRLVTLLNDSNIYNQERKFKTDKLILNEEISFDDYFYFQSYSKGFCKKIFKIFVWIKCIDIDSDDFVDCVFNDKIGEILNYLKQYPDLIRFIKNPNEKINIFVLNINGLLLKYIENQTKDICVTAVKNDFYAMKYIDEHFKETCVNIKENEIDKNTFCKKLKYIEQNYDLKTFIEYINLKKINIKELKYCSLNYSTDSYIKGL